MSKFWLGIACCLTAAVLLSLQFGAVSVSLQWLWQTPNSESQQLEAQILWQLRLPRIALAFAAGCALALSGALMQSISRNQLADPYLFGLVSGAGVGIALQQLCWPLEGWSLPLAAFLGALAAACLVLACLHLSRQRSVLQLLLAGIAVSFLLSSLLSLLLYLQSNLAAGKILFWLMGSVANASWSAAAQVTLTLCVSSLLLWRFRRELLALSCSETFARSVGVAVGKVQLVSLLMVCALTAVTVAYCGGIALIGLVAPHIARRLCGEDHRFYLPASAMVGALVLSLAAITAKQILPGAALPVGVVTALVGVPFFLAIVLRRGGLA